MKFRKSLIALMIVGAVGAGSYPKEAEAACCVAAAINVINQRHAQVTSQISSFQAMVQANFAELKLLITETAASIRAEIAKQTQVIRSTEEAIATYEVQEKLRRDAVEIAEKMTPPANLCGTIAMSGSIGNAEAAARSRAQEFTSSRLDKRILERDVRARIVNSYERATKKYCTQLDIARGECTGTPDFINGDINAALMFGSASGKGLTYDAKQSSAVDAYIERIAGMPAPALPMACDTDQCKAYEELRKDYEAAMSLVSYSLAEISSGYNSQPGLAKKAGVSSELGKDDASMMETIEAFINKKFSKESLSASATAASPETLLREMAQNQAFRLWIDFNALRQMERVEAMQAAQLSNLTMSRMRAQLDAQRAAAIASATSK